MPQRFAATEKAVEGGLDKVSPKNGAKLVHDWSAELEKIDMPGAKGVHADLDRLAKELEKDDADPAKITKILGKLGPATVKLADKCEDEKVADKVRHLGKALVDSGTESDDEEK